MSHVLPSLALALAAPALVSLQAQAIPGPSQFLGIQVGADRVLADYGQITRYFQELAKRSPRVQLEPLGKTTQGRDMVMAVISSPENLKQKARYQAIARKLADPRGLDAAEKARLVKEGKAVVLVTCAIHSSEIGSTQMALEWAHALATSEDAAVKHRLEEVILLVVPSLNPDGHDMEVDWYRKQLGTPFEGGRMPWLYHWYVGHDNNRDWVNLTQKESQAMSRAVYRTWHPQVWLDEHQMGSTGARLFIPPYSNPVSPVVHPLVWRQVDQLSSFMALRLEQAGKAGVGYGFSFDAYWPGGTKNTAWFKNTVGILSEMASVRVASPIEVHPTELSGMGKGLTEYQAQVNFPNPWKGGTWRLRDIMDYERILSDGLLEMAAERRADLLASKLKMAEDSIALGRPDRWWRIPAAQRDPASAAKLARLMLEHGVEVRWDEGERAWLIPSAQPYGRFVKELFSINRYPEVSLQSGAAVLPPYDITAWNLPLHMGVDVQTVTLDSVAGKAHRLARPEDGPKGSLEPGAAVYALDRASNAVTPFLNAFLKAGGRATVALEGFEAGGQPHGAGTLLLEPSPALKGLVEQHGLKPQALAVRPKAPTLPQKPVRVGLYKSFQASMDEGWTRFVLDQAGFAPESLDNKAVKAGKLRDRLDVVVLASQARSAIVEGRSAHDAPAEFAGGIGKEGLKALKSFVEEGGTLVALGSSSELAIEEFALPVRNVLGGGRGEAAAPKEDETFNAPGTLVRVQVEPSHPVTWGMPPEAAAFLNSRMAFQTSLPRNGMTRSVLAQYPEDARDILLSGYLKGAAHLERKTAAAAFGVGKGRVVLFGFAVQHRAQTDGTFKLLWNALHWGGLEK